MKTLLHKIRYRNNQLMALASQVTGLSLSRPTYICAKMTMRCNSRCIHCDIWKIDYNEKELTTEQWMATINLLHGWLGDFQMVITGGEALLRPDMLTIFRHAVGLGIHVELLTNGIMVNNELAESIVTAGIGQVTISYDGMNAATHDRFRGAEGFHAATLSAIFAFTKYRKLHDRPLKILLKTVISRNNLLELGDIARFAESLAVNVRFQPIEENYAAKPEPEWYKKSDMWVDDIELLKSQIEVLRKMKTAGALIDNAVSEMESYVRYFEYPAELMADVQAHEVGRSQNRCSTAVSSFVISGNGDVRMCWMMDPIGNVAINNPKKIWSGRIRCWAQKCGFR